VKLPCVIILLDVVEEKWVTDFIFTYCVSPLKIPQELEALGVIVLYTDKYSPNKRITLKEKTIRRKNATL